MSYTSEVLADSPEAYYLYDETGPLGVAAGNPLDSSGNGHDVTNASGSPTYQITGPIISDATNYGIDFTGDTWFFAPDDPALDFGDTFTLEAWLKRNAASGAVETFLFKGTNGWQFIFFTDNTITAVKSGVALIVSSTITITDTTTWHHCVWTKSGATNFLYIDGVDRTGAVTNSTINDTTVPVYMSTQGSGSEFLNASMARPAIYPTALSAARVLAHYEAATAVPDTGLAWIRA